MATAAKVIPLQTGPEEELTTADLTRQALEEAGGVIEDATRLLEERVLNDNAFLTARLPEIVHEWASRSVRRMVTNRRIGISASAAPVDGAVFRDAARANAARLMEMSLWGGKPIGEATAEEIYASADLHDQQARSHSKKATWEAAVAAALEKNGNSGDKCRDCLTEATLAKLWEEASDAK